MYDIFIYIYIFILCIYLYIYTYVCIICINAHTFSIKCIRVETIPIVWSMEMKLQRVLSRHCNIFPLYAIIFEPIFNLRCLSIFTVTHLPLYGNPLDKGNLLVFFHYRCSQMQRLAEAWAAHPMLYDKWHRAAHVIPRALPMLPAPSWGCPINKQKSTAKTIGHWNSKENLSQNHRFPITFGHLLDPWTASGRDLAAKGKPIEFWTPFLPDFWGILGTLGHPFGALMVEKHKKLHPG